jgi:TPR repeat protein
MKSLWMAGLASALLVAPAAAQHKPARTPAAAQEDPVKAGVDAYDRGDYRTALAKWRPEAERGNADAQFNMGQAYKLGRGVPADSRQAEDWYRKAVLQGHEQAEGYFGVTLFENGKRAEAVKWLQRAVGRDDARAQYILGVMLFNADGVQKDWVRAYALMVRSSSTGLDPAIKARAQMDQFMPLDDRQKGLALSRKYEEEYRSGGRPLLPVEIAENQPAPPPVKRHAAAGHPPAPRPAQPRNTRSRTGSLGARARRRLARPARRVRRRRQRAEAVGPGRRALPRPPSLFRQGGRADQAARRALCLARGGNRGLRQPAALRTGGALT